MPYGVTSTGFSQKTLDDLKTELEDALKADLGDSIDVSAEEPLGQIIGVMAERFADLWALGGAIHAAFQPDSATGTSLDNVCAITGTVRDAAFVSTVTLTATGTPGVVLPAGRIASVASIGTRFVTLVDGTIAAVSAWVGLTAYAAGDRVKNNSRVYQCDTPGTSDATGGPTGTGSAIGDDSVVWRYLGEGTGAIDIEAEAEETGPNIAQAGTLTTIETPVSNWASVTNVLDAELGADEELDAALRIKREDELRVSGKAALEAIRAAVLQVEGVTTAKVFENDTDTTDGDGIPPHAVEALVRGGDDEDVLAAVFASVAGGIGTHGTTTGTVTDSQGVDHTVKFSRPTAVPIYIIVNATVDADTWPDDGEEQVKDAIVAWGDAQRTGKNAVAAAVGAQAFLVPGLLDATVLIGTINPPVASTTIAISVRELATYDTSRISVAVTPGVP